MAVLLHLAMWAGEGARRGGGVAQAAWKASHIVNASLGQSVTLPSNLKDHPEIIQWSYRRRNREPSVTLCEKLGNRSRVCLPPFNTHIELLPDYRLRFSSVTPSDNGLYRLVVWYIWDEMTYNVLQLQVYEPVQNVSILVTRAMDSKACLLHCVVSRGSELHFIWHSAGCELTSDQLHNITNDGSYLIVSITTVHTINPSLYSCIVSNPVSEQSVEVNLKRNCNTEFDMKLLPIWAIALIGIFGFILTFFLLLFIFLYWCSDMRWFLRSRRAWIGSPSSQQPVFGSIVAITQPVRNPQR